MNKYCNIERAIEELETTQGYEILPEPDEEKEAKETLLKTNTKAEYVRKLKSQEYSEFMTGLLLGMMIGTENKPKKQIWLPAFARKR